MRKTSIAILSLLFMVSTGCSDKKDKQPAQKGRSLEYTEQVAFLNSEKDTLTSISVAVADNQKKRSEGLMDVNDLPAGNGMLFKFEQEQPLSFWMANTPLSLDIIFVDANKKIVRIHQNTQPFTQENFKSEKPAMYAVETNAGFCLSHDIQEGMYVSF